VNNQGSSGSGVVFTTGQTLHVENCVVNGFSSGSGVSLNSPTGTLNLEVKDSIMRGNFYGIRVQPSSGLAFATIDQVRLENGTYGLVAGDSSTVTVRNSIASRNGRGFLALSSSIDTAELNMENCVASNNQGGIAAQSLSTGVARVRVSNSTVTNNGVVGIVNDGSPAVLLSRGNNTVEGNTTNTAGTIGSYTPK